MVWLGARRGDDDLGPVTDRAGWVEGRAVIASSRGVRGRHSTSHIPYTSAPIGPGMYYEPGATRSSTQAPSIPFRTHPLTTSHHPYTLVPYDPYAYSQAPRTSYDPYAHAPFLPICIPGLDPKQYFSRTQIPLNEVIGPGLQLGAHFFEQLAGSIQVDSSYSGAEYGATDRGNYSSDAGWVGILCEDDGGHDNDDDDDDDDDDDGDGDGDDDGDGNDHELVPMVEALSSGHRLTPGKGKGLTSSFISVMSKIAGSQQKRPEKLRPPTNPTQRKKVKNDG
ncbi:hypothetical protein M9H77_06616 [Catharanthus roseus]|uniref:Uncharacterized protein n=1 Tax=Catharanthus roseus TaxID=4058 RepID=A0ACC0BSN9_CATRO|nr:hypothetical protein M9H77_06616 [Catharanthus roseus]